MDVVPTNHQIQSRSFPFYKWYFKGPNCLEGFPS